MGLGKIEGEGSSIKTYGKHDANMHIKKKDGASILFLQWKGPRQLRFSQYVCSV
jgi:hypothetical protein